MNEIFIFRSQKSKFTEMKSKNRIIYRNEAQPFTRYLLKFTLCSLLVVKSLVASCKIRLLLVAEIARCKKSLVASCKIRSLLAAEVARYKKSLVARCEISSLLIAEVARCKNSLVTYCIKS